MDENREFNSHGTTHFVHHRGRVFAKSIAHAVSGEYEPPLDEARQQCVAALQRIRKALITSYGPHGGLRSVRGSVGHVRDGKAIVESIDSHTLVEKRLAQTIRSLTQTISMEIGDGRKTGVLLCLAMAERGVRATLDGADDVLVSRSIVEAAESAANNMRTSIRSRRPENREMLLRVAETAMCGNHNIAERLCEAVLNKSSSKA
jgi:chaperonin GroEL (HSP60 family)